MTGGGDLAILIIVVKCPCQVLSNHQLSLKPPCVLRKSRVSAAGKGVLPWVPRRCWAGWKDVGRRRGTRIKHSRKGRAFKKIIDRKNYCSFETVAKKWKGFRSLPAKFTLEMAQGTQPSAFCWSLWLYYQYSNPSPSAFHLP